MQNSELRLYSKSETAKMLGIGKEKLGKLLDSGRIGFIQIDNRIHIPYSEILNFVNNSIVHREKVPGQKESLQKAAEKTSAECLDSISIFNHLLQENTNGKRIH